MPVPARTDRVALPDAEPPVRPEPAVTPVMSPPLSLSSWHDQELPFDFRTWLLEQVCRARLTVPLDVPPMRPLPTAVLTPLIVPPLLSSAWHAQPLAVYLRICPGTQVCSPSVALPLVAPPVKPAPAVTPVMSPPLSLSSWHDQELPF